MAAISDTGRNLPSPWSHVLRGGNDLEAVANATPSSPSAAAIPLDAISPRRSPPSPEAIQILDGGDAAKAKKPAWNVPANGVVEVSPVMGASWPALTRASPKTSSDSLKTPGDGSVTAPASASQGAAIPSSPQKQNSNLNNNTNPNSPRNHVAPTRQKSMKRGVQPPPSVETAAENVSDKPAVAGVDSSPREVSRKNNNSDTMSMGAFGSQQSHPGNDQPRGSFRRGNGGGPHTRGGGDGSYHGSYGSRRDQDRQNQEWNPHQNFSGRDIHVRQPRGAGPRSFGRPQPPSPPPFITPPVRHYAGPMGFPDMRSPPVYYVQAPTPESLAGAVPYVAAPPGMFISAPDPVRAMLVKQIDYYFSPENLCKDIYLRQNMDEQGWVPIFLIASFNRVKQLTMYIHVILEAVRASTVVEVQGDKIRKRNDWMNWLLPPPNVFGSVVHSPMSPNYDTLATRMQSIGLESTANHNMAWGPAESQTERVLTRSSSGEPSSLLHSNWEEMEQTNIQRGSKRPTSVRSLEKSGSC